MSGSSIRAVKDKMAQSVGIQCLTRPPRRTIKLLTRTLSAIPRRWISYHWTTKALAPAPLAMQRLISRG